MTENSHDPEQKERRLMPKIFRRALAAGMLVFAGMGAAIAQERVVFANYGGIVADFNNRYCAPRLMERYGITLQQVAISDPLGQLKVQQATGTNLWDVFPAEGEIVITAAANGWLEPIDWSIVDPNNQMPAAGRHRFGVAVGMEISLHPLTRVYAGNLWYPAELAGDVTRRWLDWTASAPDELTSSVAWLSYPDLEGLPVPREAFGAAKLLVAACWWLGLTLATLAEGFAIGALMNLPGLTTGLALHTISSTLLGATISFLLVPVVAWVAVAARNVLAPVGFALGMLLLGDVVGHTGWAGWFPWSIVPLLTGMTGDATPVPWTSAVVLALTFAAGLIGTGLQLRLADNP